MKIKKTFYRRNLPHIQPVGGTFFVTFLLHGAMPKERRMQLDQEDQIIKVFSSSVDRDLLAESPFDFNNFDRKLNSLSNSPHWLKKKEIAQAVANCLHFWDDKRIELICYCIMSNHVHIVITTFDKDELYRIISYVLDNPIKAGLCQHRKDWKWSYIKPEYNEFM